MREESRGTQEGGGRGGAANWPAGFKPLDPYDPDSDWFVAPDGAWAWLDRDPVKARQWAALLDHHRQVPPATAAEKDPWE